MDWMMTFWAGAGQAHGDDGDGDGRLEHLPDLEAEVGRRGGEQHHHQDADADGIRGDLGIFLGRVQDGDVLLAGLQLTLRVLRERYMLLFFHRKYVCTKIQNLIDNPNVFRISLTDNCL